jgi:hypothetical protein
MASDFTLPIVERLRREHALVQIAPSLGPAFLNPNGQEAMEIIEGLYDALDEALGLILDAYQLHTYDAEAVKRLEGVLAKAKAEQVSA